MRTLCLIVVGLAAMSATLAAPLAEQYPVAKGELNTTDVLVAECTLGNLVADALLAAGKADAALVNASALNSPYAIPAGPIKPKQLAEALPYPEDRVVVLTLKGDRLLQALERAVALSPQKNKGFLQVSGLDFSYDSSKSAGRPRVVAVVVGGQPLNPVKAYRVAMPEPLAKGGLGYFPIFTGAPSQKTDLSVLAVLASYVQQVKVLNPKLEGRIRDLAHPTQNDVS